MSPRWPPGTARALLATDHVTEPTRKALEAKLAKPAAAAPRALDAGAFATLRSVAARLVPQDGAEVVDLAGLLDARLADGKRDGWRYDVMPPDLDAIRRGLAGLDEAGRAMFGAAFAALAPADQDAVLAAVQDGSPPGDAWRELPAALWFQEVLSELAEIYAAHPFGQEAIGYVGFADAHGWRRIGLDEHEAIEPMPLGEGERAP